VSDKVQFEGSKYLCRLSSAIYDHVSIVFHRCTYLSISPL